MGFLVLHRQIDYIPYTCIIAKEIRFCVCGFDCVRSVVKSFRVLNTDVELVCVSYTSHVDIFVFASYVDDVGFNVTCIFI